MTTDSRSLRFSSEKGDYEDFEDEVVVIEHGTGAFFSLKGLCAVLWRQCVKGVAAERVEEEVEKVDPETAAILRRMLAEFESAGIFVWTDVETGGDDGGWAANGPTVFEKNEDLDDLIKMDPIHDVDERGWPHRADE